MDKRHEDRCCRSRDCHTFGQVNKQIAMCLGKQITYNYIYIYYNQSEGQANKQEKNANCLYNFTQGQSTQRATELDIVERWDC